MTREPSAASTVGCVAFVAACLIPVGLVYFAPYPSSLNIPWLLGLIVALALLLWALIILNRRRFLLVAANIAVIGVLAWLLGTAWKATELDPTEVPIPQATAPTATLAPQAVVTTSTVVATAAPVAASASASRAAATPRAERMAASVDEHTKPLISLGTALFNTGVILVGIMLGAYLLWRLDKAMWDRLARGNSLVMPDITNASGDEKIDKALASMSQVARGAIAAHLRRLPPLLAKAKQPFDPSLVSTRAPVSEAVPDQELANLTASLGAFAPAFFKPFVQLLTLAFTTRAVRVTALLQQHGADPDRYGIQVESTYPGSGSAVKSWVLWELPSKPTPAPASTNAKPVEAPTTSAVERSTALVEPAMARLALQLAKSSLLPAPSGLHYRSHFPWFGLRVKDRDEYESQVHNFFGVRYAMLAREFPAHDSLFYDIAGEQFRMAIDCKPDWYIPYMNLGDTYSYIAEAVIGGGAGGGR